jgi:hypothetical protein
MKDQQVSKLQEAIRGISGKIRKYQDRSLGEQNTKASLVEPVLEALGWDIRDPDEVFREFKPTSKDNPVDYALTILRKPRLFVEAKGLGETLSDRRWISQVLGYATVAGVVWCVLTDGDEYRFYNATAPLDADEKLFCQVKLSGDDESDVANTLTLISRSNMEENFLDVLWNAHYVDRRVKQTLQEMFSSPDKRLIRLIRSREPKLSPKDILESIRRIDIRIESATPIREDLTAIRQGSGDRGEAVSKTRTSGSKTKKYKIKVFGVPLSDLIRSGQLRAPLKLFRKYKGRMMEATLLPDGDVEFKGKRYQTCSTAAEEARSTVTGRRMNTNGWSFWQFVDGDGKTRTLFDVRERYLAENKPKEM